MIEIHRKEIRENKNEIIEKIKNLIDDPKAANNQLNPLFRFYSFCESSSIEKWWLRLTLTSYDDFILR